MFTAGMKKRFLSLFPVLTYSSLLVVLVAVCMAQTGMLPSAQPSTELAISQPVTGNEMLAYLKKLRGQNVLQQTQYRETALLLQEIGDRSILMLGTLERTSAKSDMTDITNTPAAIPVSAPVATTEAAISKPLVVPVTALNIDG